MGLLKKKYTDEVCSVMQKEFNISNVNALPRIDKICLSMGVGKALDDSKLLDSARKNMTMIAGQMSAVTKAKVSVSNFHLRQGYSIGCRVTLRAGRMYDFLERLINIAVPRIRDFRGINPKGFDKQGNYSLGIDDISIFPEIDPDKLENQQGMNITFVIKNSNDAETSRSLLKHMGMPFAE